MPIIDTVRQHLPPKYREMAKFLVVGGTAWIVDTGIFTLLSHTVLEEKILTAKIISILVSTVLSYVLNREWSFSSRGGRERHHEAALFFVVNGLALGLNLIPLAMSRYLFGFNLEAHSRFAVSFADFVSANVIGTLIGMLFRYWAYRRFVFPDELDSAAETAPEASPDPVVVPADSAPTSIPTVTPPSHTPLSHALPKPESPTPPSPGDIPLSSAALEDPEPVDVPPRRN